VLNAAARALLESNAIAQLITINVDGSPQVSGVWVGLDGDELVIASLPKRIKVRNVERDPRVALVVQSPTKSVRGLDEYLVVHGTARVTGGGAPERQPGGRSRRQLRRLVSRAARTSVIRGAVPGR